MNVFLDDFLVGLVLLAGFGYAAYALGPVSYTHLDVYKRQSMRCRPPGPT